MTVAAIGPMAIGAAVFALLWVLHRDIAALRREIGTGVDGFRRDMSESVGGLRQGLRGLRQDMGEGIGGLRRDLGDIRARMARVEGLLEGAILRSRLQSASD